MCKHRPWKSPVAMSVLACIVLVLASNVPALLAQDVETLASMELLDLQQTAEGTPADSSGLLDDYVNCPPDDAIEPDIDAGSLEQSQAENVSSNPPQADESVVASAVDDPRGGKFHDYPPKIRVHDGGIVRPIGMRPKGPAVAEPPLPPIIDDQQDIELPEEMKNLSVDDVRRVFVSVSGDEELEASGDGEEIAPVEQEQDDVSAQEGEAVIQVPQQIPDIPLARIMQANGDDGYEEVDKEEPEALKYLDAKSFYDLSEGETRQQGVRKFLERHPEEIIVTSPNYPNPYPYEWNEMRNFSVEGGRGVQIIIHDLDLNATTDFLYIRAGNIEDTEEKGPVLTGTHTEPIQFLIPQTTHFTIHFVAQQEPSGEEGEGEQEHRGFQLSYAPFGEMVSPTTPTTTEIIVPQEELQWTTKEIVMSPKMVELQSSWAEIKDALSNASNMYIDHHNLSYMPSRPFDVKLLARKCPDTWRNHEDCISLEFAVPLRPIYYEPSDDDDGFAFGFGNKFLQKGFISLSTTEATEAKYELDVEHLDAMWAEFGQMTLQRAGYEAYIMPESDRILLTWIGISLAIVGTFLFVLYMIWKIDIFKDYRRIARNSHAAPVDDDKNELKKKEFDISMFPSPHQVVPTFFPTGDPYGPDAEAQYAYDNTTMSQWPEDFGNPRGYPETTFGPRPERQQQQQPERSSQRYSGPIRAYEPVSPEDLSRGGPIDFNDSPRLPRPSAGNRNNPFLSPPGGRRSGPGPRTSVGNAPPPPGLRNGPAGVEAEESDKMEPVG